MLFYDIIKVVNKFKLNYIYLQNIENHVYENESIDSIFCLPYTVLYAQRKY